VNPQRNVPFAVIGSIAITVVIYVAPQVAFITALPEYTLANGWVALSYANARNGNAPRWLTRHTLAVGGADVQPERAWLVAAGPSSRRP
jgi:amino acid transporter